MSSTESISQPLDTLLWIFVAISIGCIYRYIFNRYKLYVPYSIALLLTGLLLGLIELQSAEPNNVFTQSQSVLAHIDPNLLLLIFIPPLLFASAFNIRFHVIWNSLFSSVLLAFPGVGIITVILAVSAQYMFTEYLWSWPFCFLFAAVLGSTDPVAVVSILRDVGAPQILSTIIEGESLLNDGSSYVLFLIFINLVTTSNNSAGSSIALFFQIALGGPAFGYAFGVCIIWFLQHVYNDIETEITTTIVGAYFVFYIADAYLNVSSYLAVVTMALYMAKYKHCISPEVHTSLKHTWQVIAFVAETLIFLLSGVIVSERIFVAGSVTAIDVGYLFITWAMLQVSRLIVVIILSPLMKLSSIELNWREQFVISWSGLRGAVALVLALLTYLTPGIPQQESNRVIFITGGNVFLTLVLNGTSIRWLVTRLKLHIPSPASKLILQQAITYIKNKCNEKLRSIRELKHYQSIDYNLVEQYLPNQIIDKLSRQSSQLNADRQLSADEQIEAIDQTAIGVPNSASCSIHDQQHIRAELSRRFLSAMLADFYTQHSHGLIGGDVLSMLIEANEAASDTGELRIQWQRISAQFKLPVYLRLLYTNKLIRKFKWGRQLIAKYVFMHLCRSIELSTAILKSKKRISQLLDEYPELSDIDRHIINEVKIQAGNYQRKAFKAWLDVQQSYPQAFQSIQTRNATKIILHYARHEAKLLRDTAMLESTEYKVLKYAIEEQLFRLERKSLNINLPSSDDILFNLPFLQSLPTHQRDVLIRSGKLRFLQHGETLYEKNQQSGGMYIIVRGCVTVRYQVEHFRHDFYTNNDHTYYSTINNNTHNTYNNNNHTLHTVKQHFKTDDHGAVHTFRYRDGTAKRVRKEKLGVGSIIGAYDCLTRTGTLSSARAQTFVQLYYFSRHIVLELINDTSLGDILFRMMATSLFKSKFYDYIRRKKLSFMHTQLLADAGEFIVLNSNDRLTIKSNQHVLVLTGTVSPYTNNKNNTTDNQSSNVELPHNNDTAQTCAEHDSEREDAVVHSDHIQLNERNCNISAAGTTELNVSPPVSGKDKNNLSNNDDIEYGTLRSDIGLIHAPCLLHCNSSDSVNYNVSDITRIIRWTDNDEQYVCSQPVDTVDTLDEEAAKYGYELTLMEKYNETAAEKLQYDDQNNWISDEHDNNTLISQSPTYHTVHHKNNDDKNKSSTTRHPTALELRLQHKLSAHNITTSVKSLPAKLAPIKDKLTINNKSTTIMQQNNNNQLSQIQSIHKQAPKLSTLPHDMFTAPDINTDHPE